MNFYFDYIYYRITKLYYKYDSGTGVYGILIISMTEGILVMELVMCLNRFFFTAQQLQDSKIIGIIIASVSILPFSIFNYIKYVRTKGKYEKFKNYWENESRSKRIFKGCLIFISLLIPWLLIFIVNAFYQCIHCGFKN
jgi:hypothetical protein